MHRPQRRGNSRLFARLCRTLWKSCSGFGDSRRCFAQESSGMESLAIAGGDAFDQAFRHARARTPRSRARRPRRITSRGAARRRRTAGPVRRSRMATRGLAKAVCPGPPKRGAPPAEDPVSPSRMGPCRTPACRTGRPVAVRRPEGARRVLRSGQAPDRAPVRPDDDCRGRRPDAERPARSRDQFPWAAARRGRRLRARPRQRLGWPLIRQAQDERQCRVEPRHLI